MVGSRPDNIVVYQKNPLCTYIYAQFECAAGISLTVVFLVTVNIEGIGTVCSYSCFDFER